MNMLNRRSFLKTAGVATGAAVISASPAIAAAIEPDTIETTPTARVPKEPVVAIVRDAGLGEVTVLSGKTENTYKDRLLAKRIMKAAGQNHRRTRGKGGVA